MQHGERERELMIQLSAALRETERLQEALGDAFEDGRAADRRADAAEEALAAANARADAAEHWKAIYYAEAIAAQEALAAARRECEAMRAILVSALYEDGYCEMTTSGKLLEPQGHAPGCDSDPPHRCVCWVMKAYALAAPAAAAGEEGT